MGMPAARVGDMHVCPAVTVLVPHVGGPILPPGAITVIISGMPAARMNLFGVPDAYPLRVLARKVNFLATDRANP